VATRAPAGIDLDALAGWFAEYVPQFQPPFTADQIAGGRSNITVRLTDANGNVVRRCTASSRPRTTLAASTA